MSWSFFLAEELREEKVCHLVSFPAAEVVGVAVKCKKCSHCVCLVLTFRVCAHAKSPCGRISMTHRQRQRE